MKKVAIYAYTNFNLGDDLFIKVLCDRYRDTMFLIMAPNEYKKKLNIKNLTIYNKNKGYFIRIINYIFRKLNLEIGVMPLKEYYIALISDCAVRIGGSIFIQFNENWKYVLKNAREIKYQKFQKNKPLYLIGANFGPYKDEQFLQENKKYFKNYTDICFREKYSYNLFTDLSNVRVADDVVFQLKPHTDELTSEKLVFISVIKPSIRNELNSYDDIYYNKIRDISISYIKDGYKVALVSFCKNEGDEEAIKEIFNQIPLYLQNKVLKQFYTGNIDEILDLLAKSSFVVATRFHSMILGFIYNKPVLPIIYSKKMKNVLEDINFTGISLDLTDIEHLEITTVQKAQVINLTNIEEAVKNSEKQFQGLDLFLNQ